MCIIRIHSLRSKVSSHENLHHAHNTSSDAVEMTAISNRRNKKKNKKSRKQVADLSAALLSESSSMITTDTLTSLGDDVQICIYSYVDVKDWRSLMACCKNLRLLFLRRQAIQALWFPYANLNYFQWEVNNKKDKMKVIDDLNLSTAASSTIGQYDRTNMNLSLLWSMGQKQPHSVDTQQFYVNSSELTFRARQRLRRAAVVATATATAAAAATTGTTVGGTTASVALAATVMAVSAANAAANAVANAVVAAAENNEAVNNLHHNGHNGQNNGANQDRRNNNGHNDSGDILHPLFLNYFQKQFDFGFDDDSSLFDINVVQFNGRVGVGDRCLCSDQPLPRPKLGYVKARPQPRPELNHEGAPHAPSKVKKDKIHKILKMKRGKRRNSNDSQHSAQQQEVPVHDSDSETERLLSDRERHYPSDTESEGTQNTHSSQERRERAVVGSSSCSSTSVFKYICRSAKTFVVNCTNPTYWKPFVAPYRTIHDRNAVHLTPRLVSYFEVTILPANSNNPSRDTEIVRNRRIGQASSKEDEGNDNPPNNDCIAVGLGNKKFHKYLHCRMPGWDEDSYGYHSDDGGIFHGSGGMLKKYGPNFGTYDTIGCGIDYLNQGIFFTLNGKFLGYAFENLSVSMLSTTDFYPIVGIDTNELIYCNFNSTFTTDPNGQQAQQHPFVFDLTSMILQHEKFIQQNCHW